MSPWVELLVYYWCWACRAHRTPPALRTELRAWLTGSSGIALEGPAIPPPVPFPLRRDGAMHRNSGPPWVDMRRPDSGTSIKPP